MDDELNLKSTDYWFKIVEFLQQNWGVIEITNSGCTVYFFGDTAGVFDQLDFHSIQEAEYALRRNGWGLCRKVPKRPHSGRRFGWGMGNIRRIWTRLMPSRKLFPGALCAMPVSS